MPTRSVTDIFVGREQELATLCAMLDAADIAHGGLVFLAGEPGIGKTRTAREFASYAQARGVEVLLGRCDESEGAPPFWPWVQVIRAYTNTHALQELRSTMGGGAADIAHVVAEVRAQLPDLSGPPALTPKQARFRFFDSITTFLKTAARSQPLLIILDDLHWADQSSLLLLQFLAREVGDSRLLVVGAYRDINLGPHHPLAQALGEFARQPHCRRLFLQGFTPQDMAHFIEAATGALPKEMIVAAVFQHTGGNPFFVTEVVEMLVAEANSVTPRITHPAGGLPVPPSVCEVISCRVQRLSATCRTLLLFAAVIGREFGFPVLQALGATCAPRLSAEQVCEALDEATTARVLAPVPHTVGQYAFSHALVRDALYETLSTAQRTQYHRRVGEAVVQVFGTQNPAVLSALASHFFLAAQGGVDLENALVYTTRAGHHAMTLLAYEEAAAYYTQMLQLLTAHGHEEVQQCAVLLALGEAQRRAGHTGQAKQTFQQAAELARRIGSPENLAHAALGFALGFTGVAVTGGVASPYVIDLLQEALSLLPAEDSPLRARVLGRLAMELYWFPTPDRRLTLSQRAVEMARRLGDPATVAYTLNARLVALYGPDHLEERLALAADTQSRNARRTQMPFIISLPRCFRSAAAQKGYKTSKSPRKPWLSSLIRFPPGAARWRYCTALAA